MTVPFLERVVRGWRTKGAVRPSYDPGRVKNARRGRRGVTLMEVMVVLGLFTVMTSGLFSLFMSSLSMYDRGSSKGDSDTVASIALQKASREIANGKSASVSSGVLTVQLPGVNDQGNYDRTVDGNRVALYVSNGKLYKQIISASTTTSVLEDGVTSATFVAATASVSVTIVAQAKTGMRTQTTQMTQVVALRNYDAP